MLMPSSTEFIALCQSQIAILTQGLGASLSVVYLTEEFSETVPSTLMPIAAYPEVAIGWEAEQVLALLSLSSNRSGLHLRLLNGSATRNPSLPALPSGAVTSPLEPEDWVSRQQPFILPLVHEGVMMGLLVTARADRHWDDREQSQIEHIADTLSFACLLDQRSQWLTHAQQQQHLLQTQQHDIFDDLLHQFRNPLTALRTFGKLLLKRLLPSDGNRDVAASMVRESDRLQTLLQEFEKAIDLGHTDLLPEQSSLWNPSLRPALPSLQASVPSLEPDAVPLQFLSGTQLELAPHAVTEVLIPLLDSAQAIAQERQLTLQVQIPDPLPPIQVDLRALYEVLNNLMDNALKYTPAHGTIYLWVSNPRWSDTKGMQAIAIADTGPGIPPQDLEHLFERHYRGIQSETSIPGTGLGLAIARNLIRQMQGEIQVFSPAATGDLPNPFQQELIGSLDPGTLFVIWVPEAMSTFNDLKPDF